jgi:AcrR family transcriptional regulator
MSRPKKLSDSELLFAAYDVIGREGFESFTLQQVAKRMDLSPAALVKRFKTKEQLARAARKCKWDADLGQMESAGDNPTRGVAAVMRFVSLIATTVKSKRPGEHGALFSQDVSDPQSKRKVAAYFQSTRDVLRRALREAVEDKELNADLDPEKMSWTLEALIQGAIFQFSFLNEHDVGAHLRTHVERLLESQRISGHRQAHPRTNKDDVPDPARCPQRNHGSS